MGSSGGVRLFRRLCLTDKRLTKNSCKVLRSSDASLFSLVHGFREQPVSGHCKMPREAEVNIDRGTH